MTISSTDAKGFSLVELMVVIAIIGIISAVAFPAYTGYLQKSRRLDATVPLVDLAARLQRFYTDTNNYNTATIGAAAATDILASSASPEGYYTLSIVAGNTTATTYQIMATRVSDGLQAKDTACGNFTLTNRGLQGVTGTNPAESCW